ncbi:MAG TPA: glutathione peroxidase [Bacteroidota bacterium]|nr:glutathione peroxidase [Bacteroidota bacterium]
MKIFLAICTAFFLVINSQTTLSQTQSTDSSKISMHEKSVLDFTMTTIDGKPRPLSSYKGKVLMIVNTASKCGFTPQYETLEKLYETYKDSGFQILAFPANNFGKQEPGTNSEIKDFCSTKFHTTFDLFEKISVKGDDQHPLYQYITKESPYPGEIKWNFQKYLVDRSGKIVEKYYSITDPMSDKVRSEVEKLLAEKVK